MRNMTSTKVQYNKQLNGLFKQITLILVLLSIISTTIFGNETAKNTISRPAFKADIFVVEEPQDLAITLTYPAIIKAFKKVQVVSRILGILEEKNFEEGQIVQKGDLLYQIEDDIYLAKVKAAKASLKMSQASLNNDTKNWARVKKLFKQKAISQERRDTALFNYQESLASVSLSKANLTQAQIDLSYTKVKAPISGVIGLKQIDVGALVSSTTKLIQITQNNKVYVEFSMPMSDYKNIKNNLWSIKNQEKINLHIQIDNKLLDKKASVDFIDVNTNNQTSIVKMRAILDNSDNYLMPGQFVRVVSTNIVQKDVITVPQKAVLQNPLGTIVFIESAGKVGVKPIVIGNETGNNYVVAGGPIKSGDKIIVNNFFRLKPGGNVTIDKIINQKGN